MSDQRISIELRDYRHVAGAIGVAVAGAMAFAAFGLTGWGGADVQAFVVPGILVLGSLALVLLHQGYFVLKDSLARADAEHSAMLASVHRDSLTGALTRSYFLDRLKAELASRDHRSVGYIQLDMDHLKLLNDSRGHAAGDTALACLVDRVCNVMPDAVIGRLGGDEFGVIVPGCDSHKAIRRLCTHILEELEHPVTIAARRVHLSATMGIALAPADAITVDELISKADLALYKGKSEGRNTAVVFEKDMYSDERHKRYIERELRAAILMNELELHYQPIFDSDGETLRSAESLVRWRHPVRGIVPPGEFIHIAEMSDLIDKLGEWVLRRACADLDRLGAPFVAVNVSAAQLQRNDFAERFAAILEETGTGGSSITVEITETVPLASDGTEKVNLDAIRALGVKIAIDDFGAGNASLSYIKTYAFDILKIDKSYVDAIATSQVDAMVVSAICRIARTAGMKVIAEGVETHEQLETLRRLGCCSIQGYLLGRPQPLRAFAAGRHTGEVSTAA